MRRAAIAAFLKSPVTVSWFLALGATVTIVGVVLSRGRDRTPPGNGSETAKPATAGEPRPALPPPGLWQPDGNDDVGARLRRFARLLERHYGKHGRFPAGTFPADGLPPDQRLSWMAVLAADSKRFGGQAPQWGRSWRDPVNEPFTRQRIDLFRNPALRAEPGADGLPVTHVVGVAGVGVDGPFLPSDHRRAGIFGYNRATRRRDVRDGLANTMMLAGVHRRLGGWAVGGHATIRPFTQEPYVNGPDGFGAGRGDRMQVLMADGSVKEISGKTAPVIVRRMAAMADRFPLDPAVPGDPLGFPSPKKQPPPVVVVPKKKQPPIVVARPPVAAVKPLDVPRIDVAAALAQRILRFEHTRRKPLTELLIEVQEMAGVPFHVDPNLRDGDSSPLNRPVVAKFERVSVGEILKGLLSQAGLTYIAGRTSVRIVARPESKTSTETAK
ncbi:MAG: DUF1559 domain-containing protein [Planctomycetaceae bacterium]